MKNSKLNFKNIVFVLFTVMFFLSVNIMAQQKTVTPNKNVIPNLKGMSGMDAVAILGNLKVKVKLCHLNIS